MNGLDALPLLRATCPRAVIIVYSSDPGSAIAAKKLGAESVLDKGTDPIGALELLVDLCSGR